jgi:transcription elongation factor Elf1
MKCPHCGLVNKVFEAHSRGNHDGQTKPAMIYCGKCGKKFSAEPIKEKGK